MQITTIRTHKDKYRTELAEFIDGMHNTYLAIVEYAFGENVPFTRSDPIMTILPVWLWRVVWANLEFRYILFMSGRAITRLPVNYSVRSIK